MLPSQEQTEGSVSDFTYRANGELVDWRLSLQSSAHRHHHLDDPELCFACIFQKICIQNYVIRQQIDGNNNTRISKLRKEDGLYDLSSSLPMSTAILFRSPKILLKSESASSCFSFSTCVNIFTYWLNLKPYNAILSEDSEMITANALTSTFCIAPDGSEAGVLADCFLPVDTPSFSLCSLLFSVLPEGLSGQPKWT